MLKRRDRHVACRRSREDGMSLIELMLAMVVLAVGMAGGIGLVMTSIASNQRNKLDTSATLLAQNVFELIAAAGANATTNIALTDCQGNAFSIDPTGSATGRGAALSSGVIDFSSTPNPTTGYNMNYVVCRANGDPITYDVRWRITSLRTLGTTVYAKTVLVSARPLGAAGNTRQQLQYFALPVTLKGIVGY